MFVAGYVPPKTNCWVPRRRRRRRGKKGQPSSAKDLGVAASSRNGRSLNAFSHSREMVGVLRRSVVSVMAGVVDGRG